MIKSTGISLHSALPVSGDGSTSNSSTPGETIDKCIVTVGKAAGTAALYTLGTAISPLAGEIMAGKGAIKSSAEAVVDVYTKNPGIDSFREESMFSEVAGATSMVFSAASPFIPIAKGLISNNPAWVAGGIVALPLSVLVLPGAVGETGCFLGGALKGMGKSILWSYEKGEDVSGFLQNFTGKYLGGVAGVVSGTVLGIASLPIGALKGGLSYAAQFCDRTMSSIECPYTDYQYGARDYVASREIPRALRFVIAGTGIAAGAAAGMFFGNIPLAVAGGFLGAGAASSLAAGVVTGGNAVKELFKYMYHDLTEKIEKWTKK
jgi:hypothetical protein